MNTNSMVNGLDKVKLQNKGNPAESFAIVGRYVVSVSLPTQQSKPAAKVAAFLILLPAGYFINLGNEHSESLHFRKLLFIIAYSEACKPLLYFRFLCLALYVVRVTLACACCVCYREFDEELTQKHNANAWEAMSLHTCEGTIAAGVDDESGCTWLSGC